MQERQQLTNSRYRIKKPINNFMDYHRKTDDEPQKSFVHSASHKSLMKNGHNRSLEPLARERLSTQKLRASHVHLTPTGSQFSTKTLMGQNKKIV